MQIESKRNEFIHFFCRDAAYLIQRYRKSSAEEMNSFIFLPKVAMNPSACGTSPIRALRAAEEDIAQLPASQTSQP